MRITSQICGILLKLTNFNSNLSKWPNSPSIFENSDASCPYHCSNRVL
ncbi:MAG: hypothetical protein NPMRth3_2750003, partial [Nitrosopumilales archaeon]